MTKYKFFNDDDIRNKLRKLKNSELQSEFKKLVDAHNNHEIDRRQFDKLRNKLMAWAKESRAQILAERNQLINDAEIKYLNELAGSGADVDRFVNVYENVSKFDADKLASEYEKRLKVGDKAGMRAAAFAAAEKGINRVTNDYKHRDPEWKKTAEEYQEFNKNVASKDAKMQTGFGDPDFQLTEPKLKTKIIQFGYVGSEKQPHYIDRLEMQ